MSPSLPAKDARRVAIDRIVALLESLTEGAVVNIITCSGSSINFHLPPAPTAPTSAQNGSGEKGCRKRILTVLEDAGRRLILAEIMDEFQSRRYEDSERTVQRHLAELIKDGLIDNDQDADPSGYGLVGK